MARCGCAGTCSCQLSSSPTVAVTGNGTPANPYVFSVVAVPDETPPPNPENLPYNDPLSNALVDYSFDNWNAGVPATWGTFWKGGTPDPVVDPAIGVGDSLDGYAARVTFADTDSIQRFGNVVVPVAAGQVWQCSVWAKGTGANPRVAMSLIINLAPGNPEWFGAGASNVTPLGVTEITGDFALYSGSVMIPTGYDVARLSVTAMGDPGDTVTIDRVTMRHAAAPTTFNGVPAGGAAGDVLTKDGATDYDVTWAAPTVPVRHVYAAGATWTKPAGLRCVRVRVIGDGGGGGGTTGNATGRAAGGGGGAGGYSEKLILAAALGATETVTVGQGGAGGTNGATNGSNGTGSSFGAHCSATGGSGGYAGGTAGTGPSVGYGNLGGTGSSGDVNVPGGSGQPGLTLSATWATAGSGGNAALGGGGRNRGNQGTGFDGTAGGGGGGAYSATTTYAGGNGGAGLVIVEEYY